MAIRSEREAPDRGTPLVLTSAGDVGTLVRARGARFIVTNRNGDITPAGARELGLFSEDTRYLSYYELRVDAPDGGAPSARDGQGVSLVYLSSNAFDTAQNRIDLMVSGYGSDEPLDDPQNFLHVRRRQIVADAFREQIEIVNYLQRPVELVLFLGFAADFADVFEIRGTKRARRGTLRPPSVRESSVDLAYEGLDGKTYRTRLAFEPSPAVLTGACATFHVGIEPGRLSAIGVSITPAPHSATTHTASRRAFDANLSAEREKAEAFIERSTRFSCDDPMIQRVLEQSTKDLHALSIPMGDSRVLAAGIPWFCCPFGRDALLTGYEALTLNPELAWLSLRALATRQGEEFDAFTEEEPGKIFHELRSGEMAACREIPQVPYYGTVDATPLFVVVADATHEVTGDDALLAELEEPIRAALRWIDDRSEGGTRLVTYQRATERGLDNQGWKDSRTGVSSPDGRRLRPPIALCEVQGYCVDAYRRGAALLARLGDAEACRTYEQRARALAELVERALWLPELGRYAFAIDGEGVPAPTVVSNVGHLLWSRLAPPDHARATADLLVARPSLSRFGIRTLATGQPAYNPLTYHNGTIWPHDNAIIAKGLSNYDLMDHACAIFEALVGAMGKFESRRLPELYCGTTRGKVLVHYPVACSPQAWAAAAPFLLLQAVLGLQIDGRRQRLLIRNPKMPASVRRVEIEGLRVGGSRVDLRIHRVRDRCHVDRLDVSGAPLRTLVEIE